MSYRLQTISGLSQTDSTITDSAKKKKNIIYGAQAMNNQLPFFLQRRTKDFDIFSNTPRKDARDLKNKLNRKVGQDMYFNKSALHPGTYKVMSRGEDGRKNTQDDIAVADYTKTPRGARYTTSGGVKYIDMSLIERDRRKALKDKAAKFRYEKDKADLERIKANKGIKKIFSVR